jgi:hypothetical protein
MSDFAKGPRKVRVVGGPAKYYSEYTTTALYVSKAFGAEDNSITLANDSDPDSGNDPVQVSFDGATLDGEIKAGEMMTLNTKNSKAFFNALDAPVRFNRKLTAALEEYDKRVISK